MLRAIEPGNISDVWHRVRAGLEDVMCATSDDWLPEDIYMSLKLGQSALFMGEGDRGEYLGFLVMKMAPTHHGEELVIWCAYSATKRPLMREFLPQIEEVARSAKAQKIVFHSARPEWAKAAKRIGFAPAQVKYEYSL